LQVQVLSPAERRFSRTVEEVVQSGRRERCNGIDRVLRNRLP
jgi:hypothetical protein